MSVRALVGITAEWWTPESETEPDANGDVPERPASFFLEPLTGPEMMSVQEFFDIENKIVRPSGLLKACRIGLKDWRNVLDGNGIDVPFDESLNKLPAPYIAAAGAQILANSVIDGAAEKNSSSQSK